jgi:mRNA-degrading endonuclease toxin of MazEF toxin-antitoxin module
MQADEICLANFPYGGSPGLKLRPVLLLSGPLGDVPEVIVAYTSSVLPKDFLPADLILDPLNSNHASTNLKGLSVLRLHKVATIHSRSIARRLGVLPAALSFEVDAKLRTLLCL